MTSSEVTEHKASWGNWQQISGVAPLLFSAPHNAMQIRNGEPKAAEPGTGNLAFRLAEQFGASALATTKLSSDPNWDPNHPYIEVAQRLLPNGVAIDFHMMRDRGFPVCIGRGVEKEMVDMISQHLQEELVSRNFETRIDSPFGAGSQTITSNLQLRGIKALQLELTENCYQVESSEYPKIYEALVAFSEWVISSS